MSISNSTKIPLVITRPREDVRRTAKYERMLRRREKTLSRLDSYRRQFRIIERVLLEGARRDDPVLEVARGTGFHLLELSARGWTRLTGLEIDPELCGLTADAARCFDLRFRAVSGDACAIPVADESCAIVMAHSCFEHVYDVDLTLSEQPRVLRPGGRLPIFDGSLLNPPTLVNLLVFYPLRTHGRNGGLRWFFGKGCVHENLYSYLPHGRDEDIHTPAWWRRRIEREPRLVLRAATTGGDFTHPELPRPLRRLLGSCIVIAERR